MILKKPYEISLWQDILMFVGTPKSGKTSPTSNINDLASVDYQYYTEQRIITLGSNTMTSIARAINPIYTRNVNGTEQLTFDMYYQYEEPTTGELVHNPIIDLIIDERKVKLKYQIDGEDDPWHDFIVKKDDEKARENKYSFTCTGLAANELGKNGFNLEFNIELENNLGTVNELTDEVLKDSDWQRDTDLTEVIDQTCNEPLYVTTTTRQITAYKIHGGASKTVPAGATIYLYYTPTANQTKDYFQFIYTSGSTPSLLEDKVTISCNDTNTFDLYINNVQFVNNKPDFTNTLSVSIYRGDRYIRKQLTHYDPTLKKTVGVYTKNGGGNTEYYGYSTTEYVSIDTVVNYIYNSENFKATSYWNIYSDSGNPSLATVTFPYVTANNATTETFTDYLRFSFNSGTNARLRNDGIIQNYAKIKSFEKEQWYRLKLKIARATISGDKITAVTPLTTSPLNCQIASYELGYVINPQKIHFNFTSFSYDSQTGYLTSDAQCLKDATWTDLSKNVSIFFLPKSSNSNTYLIEDVQLFRRIEKEGGGYLEINEVPEVRINTEWHFYNPAENIGKISADDYVYDGSNPNNYTAKYGTGDEEFEKRRSITISESNRYNIIQELSEIFECWARFKVYHESDGTITCENYDYYKAVNATSSNFTNYYFYDWTTRTYISASGTQFSEDRTYYDKIQRRRQKKRVYYISSVVEENAIGFKYGINLKDVQRTLDSDQIATKIIVKDNTREEAENGFCSISRAEDNTIKENFALNLDYYTSQGILDRNLVYNDIYLEDLNGSIGLYPKLTRLNKERNALIEEQSLLENVITNLTADTQAAYLAYNAAEDELQKILDPVSGSLYQNTGYIFDDFLNQYTRASAQQGGATGTKVPSYPSTIYCITVGTINSVKTYSSLSATNYGTPNYYRKINYESIVGGQTYYYIGSTKVEQEGEPTTYSSGHFVAVKYNKAENYPTTHQYFEKLASGETIAVGDYFETLNATKYLTFTGSGSPQVYIYLAHRREDPDFEPSYYSSYTHSIIEKIHTYQKTMEDNETKYNNYKAQLEAEQVKSDSNKEKLKEIARNTDEIEKEFYVKYARYIQEGTWTDDNYIDDDLYYLDALNVLYNSAYPKVSYNISVLELSQLEGYEAFKFNLGHKTFIEDTEFFGYVYGSTGQEPAREWVVVTETKFNLDENDKNSLKVQNYKSHFEDLFQRITAATQSLEYHSGEYAKAASIVTPEGTIDEVAMQRTMATAAYVLSNARDQSVYWDETGLWAKNLSDASQIVRLASGGLLVSADGGQTWGTAITGYGINASYINAGVIDTNVLEILNGAYPTFKWDSRGLHAFSFTENGQGDIYSYDPSRYVTFDRFGLYGINGISLDQANFNSVEEVQNNALFALTWNGLFIRNNHNQGFTAITPDNDLLISDGTNMRAHFGYISNDEDENSGPTYGMSLYDENGNATVRTQSDGTLWLLDSMRIGDENNQNGRPRIYLGRGEDVAGQENLWKVMRVYNNTEAKDKFVLYSDGTLEASGVKIEGTITATGGTIGGLQVDELPEAIGVRIECETGDTFKSNNTIVSPASLVFSHRTSLSNSDIRSIAWRYGSTPANMSAVPAGWVSNNKLTITYSNQQVQNTFVNGLMYIELNLTTTDGKVLKDTIPLKFVTDGINGSSIEITSVQYGYNQSGTSSSGVTWQSSIPTVPAGYWLWIKTTYSDNTSIETSTYMGQNGQAGQNAVVYTYAIESSAGTIINTADITSSTTTTITGYVYKTDGNSAPTEVTQNISYVWYKQEDGGTATQVATTKSFNFNLNGNWSNVQFYFIATINGAA